VVESAGALEGFIMSLKSLLVAVSISAAALVAARGDAMAAEVHWNGAGWYGIEDVVDWGWIISGPYGDQASCEAQLPADDEESEFYCSYLAEKPAWD
jgi:hypothetical protein